MYIGCRSCQRLGYAKPTQHQTPHLAFLGTKIDDMKYIKECQTLDYTKGLPACQVIIKTIVCKRRIETFTLANS